MVNPFLLDGLATLGSKLIDGLFPDKIRQEKEREDAKLALEALKQSGELEKIGHQLSAIIAEAQSEDPWTSRARPSFLYVIYAIILWSIPMGVVSAMSPEVAQNIIDGMTGYLGAMPDALWTLFGAGYLGYTGMRGIQKIKMRGNNG